jgi:hypothetical protein
MHALIAALYLATAADATILHYTPKHEELT